MKYRAAMAGYVGVDPSALAAVAGLLDDAALELRGCAALVDEAGAESTERLWVLSVAEWAESEANDLRKRSAVERALGLTPPPFGGTQHGNNNKKISAEERARLEALTRDPSASEKVKKAANRKIDADKKARGEKHSRLGKDKKMSAHPPVIDPAHLTKPAEYAGAGAASGMPLWWLGKLASPLCGPAVVACAVIG
jgi:hypothetical protein